MAWSLQGDNIPRSHATSRQSKRVWTREPELKRPGGVRRGSSAVRPPPRALISSWPRAQFMGCRGKTCQGLEPTSCAKAGKTLRNHLAGHGGPRGATCWGARGGGPPPGGECEQQGPSEGKTLFSSHPYQDLQKVYPPGSRTGQTHAWDSGQRTVPLTGEQGRQLHRSLKLPPERGTCPGRSLHPPSAEGHEKVKGPAQTPSRALFSYIRAQLELSWG